MRAKGRKRPIGILVLVALVAVVLGLSLVPGAASATGCTPGDWQEVCLLNMEVVEYCVDVSPNTGTNCGGLLKVFNVHL